MAAEDPIAIAFDVYGTLLNPSSVEPKLQSLLGSSAGTEVAAQWRVSQLEMTWLLNSMGTHAPPLTRQAPPPCALLCPN